MDAFAITEAIVPETSPQEGHEAERATTGKLPEGANKFQRAIAAWRGIDLANTVAKLDSTASDIVAQQRDALVQRKDLAQKTKDFRKLDDASKLAEYKGLLKAYQSFIDLLTNQGKASSSAFLQLYSSLSEAPDPYPLLEASVDSLVHSEETVPKLTSERDQLQGSVDRLTSQLEDTEKRLEEERTARRKLEEGQETKIKEVEESWSAVLSEKTNNWTAKEKSLEEKVEHQERLVKELKASYEVSQRLGQDGDEGEGVQHGASAAELELVSAELEKTSLRLAEVEARNEQLRLELAQAVSHSQAEQAASVEDDPAYLRLQSENSSLLRKLDAARFDRESERHSWESKYSQAERQIKSATAEKEELRSRLEKVADYEDIRRELEMIKSIEFSPGDDDEAGDSADSTSPTNGTATKAKEGSKNSLEQLLLARNKKLTDELTILRVSHRDLQGQLEALRADLSTTKEELEKSQKLSTTLENDLLRVQEEAANAFPSSAMSVAGTYTSKYPHSSRRGGAVSPTSSIISGFDQSAASANTMDSIRAGEAVGGGAGLLPMIQAQRDRFKKKNAELEEELSKLYGTVKSLRQEVASLQKDNLSLYEKTRYVSTYNRGPGGSSSASAYANKPNTSSVHSADTPSGLSLDRYQSAYEAQISPFAAFRGRESARAYKRMSLPERIVFSLTRIILANRTSRNLFAGYCVALHVLIFVMLYMMSSMEIEKHSAASLGAAAAAAMAGGGSGGGGSGAGGGSYAGQQLHGDDWQQEGFSQAGVN
ncbi:CCAAT displacement transcription factor COY1 [Aspergillus brunneoviolaceus CBS 621.78]|uniref:Uncharacterized protein n=1 Tax=Aspergillus brunneoviolaceus CBS 621.78 TaxID=1450534 RepID=A0ACD1GLZ8_9EURO|nr:hypothetical protein BO95DRAFT_438673 [Aspergillus brunneoviolaceus CBS 621.78]RAH50304.1 hypothetical protein BO95DRAFT_438673 [Aspergillus brunneoviolaceus CBS 621.78]